MIFGSGFWGAGKSQVKLTSDEVLFVGSEHGGRQTALV
jgi:hypothetical protein